MRCTGNLCVCARVNLLSVARLSGVEVPWSAMQRKSAMSRILSLMRYHGPPSFFITLAPADMDSILMLRLASFASADAWDVSMHLPTLAQRHCELAANPVVAALVYKRLLEAVLEHVVGLQPSYLRRRTVALGKRPLGVFGRIVGYAVVTEAQGRGSNPAHATLFGDMSPITLRDAIDDVVKGAEICSRLDRIVRACLPAERPELVSTLPCAEPTALHRDGRNVAATPLADAAAFESFANDVAGATNVHTHSKTCHKGAVGRYKCRLAYPRAPWKFDTMLLQLLLKQMPDGSVRPVALVDMKPRADHDAKVASDDPTLAWRDERVVVVELHRADESSADHAKADGMWCDIACDGSSKVVNFSPAMTALLGANTDVSVLGSLPQVR